MKYKKSSIMALILCTTMNYCVAATTTNPVTPPPETSAVEDRSSAEHFVPSNAFNIAFYKPNYIMPYYYTGSPYNSIYEGQTPDNEKLTRDEIKYQLSFKVPLWKNIFGYHSTLFLAYTQLSYWQAYNKLAFFRSTDYEPEVFLANEFNYPLFAGININYFNIGAEHQSNGYGNSLERSWNRVYVEGVFSKGNFMLSARPWMILQDSSIAEHNPDIGSYLGHFQLLMAYKINGLDKSTITFRTYGLGLHGGRRTSGELAVSFPLSNYVSAYVQVFSGYGQSLLEYNHRTNSAGIGISLSNWI